MTARPDPPPGGAREGRAGPTGPTFPVPARLRAVSVGKRGCPPGGAAGEGGGCLCVGGGGASPVLFTPFTSPRAF